MELIYEYESSETKNERNERNEIESKNIFENIKSKYIRQKIFDILDKKTLLKIMKYNRIMQCILDINIYDYKYYPEEYLSVEIELKPALNKYGRFININRSQTMYFHIYFDNNGKEVCRNFLKPNENIKTITIIIDYQVKSFYKLFFEVDCIESIYFKKFYRNDLTNFERTFSRCSSLKEINFSSFNTNNVTNMSFMFCECPSLQKLDLSNFITCNVNKIYYIFWKCSSLKELNISNFNTKNVSNMECMFSGCSSLKKLDLSNFNTKNVTNMGSMFSGCSSLEELNISNFNTNNVTDMSKMFYNCSDELKIKIKDKYKFFKEEAFN